MQGKERNQTRIDSPFTDHAWMEMRNMLDQEMPVSPVQPARSSKKPYALLLLVLLFGFIAGVGTMMYFDEDPIELQPIEEIQIQEVASVQKAGDHEQTAELNTALALGAGNYSSNTTSSTRSDVLKDKKELDGSFAKQPELSSTIQIDINSKPVIKSTGDINRSESGLEDQPINSSNAINPANDQNLNTNSSFAIVNSENHQPDLATKINSDPARPIDLGKTGAAFLQALNIDPVFENQDRELAFVEWPQKKEIFYGLRISNYTRQFNDFSGFSAGALVQVPLDQNFAFEAGLHYSLLCGFQKDKDASQINYAPFELNDGQDLVNIDQISTVQPVGTNKNLPIAKLHYIDLPLILTYQPARSFRIHMGVKTSYLIDAQADLDIGNPGIDPQNPQFRSDRNEALYESMKKLDVGTVLGFGYYPTKNFGLDIRYNHGLVDNTDDEVWQARQITTNQAFELSLTYLLSSK